MPSAGPAHIPAHLVLINASSVTSFRLMSTLKYAPNTPVSRAFTATYNSQGAGPSSVPGAAGPCPAHSSAQGHGLGASRLIREDGKLTSPRVPSRRHGRPSPHREKQLGLAPSRGGYNNQPKETRLLPSGWAADTQSRP